MRTTAYFENSVLWRRPYLRREWCERVRVNPEERQVQENGRISHWGYVPELAKALSTESYLRVVTLEDGQTVHNAYPDRDFTRRRKA